MVNLKKDSTTKNDSTFEQCMAEWNSFINELRQENKKSVAEKTKADTEFERTLKQIHMCTNILRFEVALLIACDIYIFSR